MTNYSNFEQESFTGHSTPDVSADLAELRRLVAERGNDPELTAVADRLTSALTTITMTDEPVRAQPNVADAQR